MKAVVEFPGHHRCFVRAEEIRPADVADKKRVTGKDHQGAVPALPVVEDIACAVRGMPRGMQGDDLQCPDPELLAVVERLPIGPGEPRTMVYPGSGDPREFTRADDIVLVPVSLEDLPDPDPMVLCDPAVDIAVSPGVDDKRLSFLADYAGQRRNYLRSHGFKQHRDSPLGRLFFFKLCETLCSRRCL